MLRHVVIEFFHVENIVEPDADVLITHLLEQVVDVIGKGLWAGHPADLEYALLTALIEAGLPVPTPLLVDTSRNLIPDPFIVMAFIEGDTEISAGHEQQYVAEMADTLAMVHATAIDGLPSLPVRTQPLPELFEYLPVGQEWSTLGAYLRSMPPIPYTGQTCLLHGDFWPENLLWQNGHIAGILDWEDAAVGDPLSDVACSRVELRYKFGPTAMQWFTEAYARHCEVDPRRLALWQIYAAAAAQHFMGQWRLPREQERHMRKEALACIREAGDFLMAQADQF